MTSQTDRPKCYRCGRIKKDWDGVPIAIWFCGECDKPGDVVVIAP